jgi:hypothetical protein
MYFIVYFNRGSGSTYDRVCHAYVEADSCEDAEAQIQKMYSDAYGVTAHQPVMEDLI